jgi:hypothetical protein
MFPGQLLDADSFLDFPPYLLIAPVPMLYLEWHLEDALLERTLQAMGLPAEIVGRFPAPIVCHSI